MSKVSNLHQDKPEEWTESTIPVYSGSVFVFSFVELTHYFYCLNQNLVISIWTLEYADCTSAEV